MLPPSGLRPAERNARTHSKKQIRQIADSIERFGFVSPVIADDKGRLAAGHARVAAAKLLGLKQVPVIRLSHLTDAEVRAFTLADNRLALSAGWDHELLALELEELRVSLPEIGLDLDITGFDASEIDAIFAENADNSRNADEDLILEAEEVAVSKLGDLFELGRHRLLVGDARDDDTYRHLIGSEQATMTFLDPPYNVKINGHVGGRGRIKHREFAFASGEMSSLQFIEFLRKTLGACADHLIDGGISYVCMDWRHAGDLLAAGADVFDELKNICVWAKTTPGQGSFYKSQHEFVFVYKRGQAPHINTFLLGQHGRTRTNVWTYPGANTFRAGRMEELKMHPTVKPVALVVDAMRDCSKRGSIVLDVFAGSGTTIMAAEQCGRRAYCMEIDPRYADVSIRRWQKATGKDATLVSTGQTFQELTTAKRKPDEVRKRRMK